MRRVIRIKPRFWLCVTAGTLMLFGVLFCIQSGVMDSQKTQIAQLQAQCAKKAEENDTLKLRIDFSKTDEYIERYARSSLGMLKEGEIRFVEGSASN